MPPCYLIIDGQPVEVVAVRDAGRKHAAAYACRCGAADGLLIVQGGAAKGDPAILWQHQGAVQQLVETQVEVYPTG